MKNEIIEIPLSSTKVVFLILGSIAFVAISAWELLYMAYNQTRFPPIAVQFVGVLGVLLSSFALIVGIRKLFDKRPGLIINQEGIDINSSGMKVGLVKWADIIGFEMIQIMSTKMLMIKVRNPKEYVDRASNKFVAKMMQVNLSQYGTPLSISSNILKIDFDSLYQLLEEKLDENT